MVPVFTLVALSLQPAPINPGILSGKYTAGNEQIMLEVSGVDPQPGLLREVVVSNLGSGEEAAGRKALVRSRTTVRGASSSLLLFYSLSSFKAH